MTECEDQFRCTECDRVVRTSNEVVLCSCTDAPTCDPCCEREHGGGA